MPTPTDRDAQLKVLRAPWPKDKIQRSNGSQTGKGYDTVGIEWASVVARLTDVFGLGGWSFSRKDSYFTEIPGRNDKPPRYESIVIGKLSVPSLYVEVEGLGAHIARTRGDAEKGAYTNALKRAAAFLGCGLQAFEGTLDDDTRPESVPGSKGGTSEHKSGGFTPAQKAELARLCSLHMADGAGTKMKTLDPSQRRAIGAAVLALGPKATDTEVEGKIVALMVGYGHKANHCERCRALTGAGRS